MGQFQNWVNARTVLGVVFTKSVTGFMGEWATFVQEHQAIFTLYERYKLAQSIGVEPDDPYTQAETARNAANGLIGPRLQQLGRGLDAYSDKVFQLAEAQRIGEKNAVLVHRERQTQTDVGEQGQARDCCVRLQVQRNFSAQGSDTLATRSVNNANGVSVAEIEQNYTEMRAAVNLNEKFKTQMDNAWEVHRAAWEDYAVGGSHSVNFDDKKISTVGRPKAGYRLDVENLRAAPGKRNFI